MAEFDMMPYLAKGGQYCQSGSGSIEASATFLKGEPVELNAAGDLIECTDEPSAAGGAAIGSSIRGIAMSGAAATAVAGASDGTRATAVSENVQLGYSQVQRGDQFVFPAARFTEANDTTFDGTIAAANRGDLCSVRTDGTDWGVCVHTDSANRDYRIIQLLDANGLNADKHGSTITQIIIECEV